MTTTFDTLPKTAKELIEISEKNYLSVGEVLTRVRELEKEARDKVVIPEYKSKPRAEMFYKNKNNHHKMTLDTKKFEFVLFLAELWLF